jgi:hypothetical protein
MSPVSKYVLMSAAILGACLSVASCSPASMPTPAFLERAVMLIYPSGPGGMGCNVKHLVDVCVEGKRAVSWEPDSDRLGCNMQ